MNYAIILAAGQSKRMLSHKDKLLVKVANHPVIYYSLAAFNDHDQIDKIVLVVNKINRDEITKVVKTYKFHKIKLIALGGLNRHDSLKAGIHTLSKFKPQKGDLIVVHNGANPLPSYNEIADAITEAQISGACIVAREIVDTIKKVKNKKVEETIDRSDLFAAQTPQVVEFSLFEKALKNADKKKLDPTDEAMLLEAIGHKPNVIPAHEHNFKITTREDIERLKVLLGEMSEDFRVGIGQDSHEFSGVSGLVLGGVLLKNYSKLEANSDGDVILHAIFNALSQSLGEHSLGFYADSLCIKEKVTDSKKFLDIVLKKVAKEKFKIGNLGLMIECKIPKIDPLVPQLKKSLSKILNIPTQKIGITATSGENLTTFGQGKGIQCFAIVSLMKDGKKK
jgi:2-C-methyl-D-erythritol 4-phosphate cytidylyltransferase/2-C-methyl-D-erythritol 2,4-cyclodiphosphate synthase